MYIENPKEYAHAHVHTHTHKLELLNDFSKIVGYKINI